ncbi:phospholipase [Altererythrobacter sp. SALINAS58]|uniref:phospholipase D-like domain-containing protein n=1 Tax=Alteripontixanthobacter muriae TaxID=2705546 RepID=UPI001575C0D5|nr:phospholipase D-like domain-containing protein [Alteripontixanthobacter muriae]NTZ42672.1 phospholipase [Alteripontixanthobacter muriae]
MSESVQQSSAEPILVEGETCWRKVRADRAAFIVDAADYFAAAKEAILGAQKSVYLIGWEFDLEIELTRGSRHARAPDQLRKFINHVVTLRPDLEIYILQWDGAMLFNIARQFGSWLLLKMQAKPNIHFRLDSQHPAGACHHQKIVVIDDVVAFCGGIDMTSGRWDTSDHLSGNEKRKEDGKAPMPWHDMTLAVEGEAAKALGELARWRWKNATGEELPVPNRTSTIWPSQLTADCFNVTLGIARTRPSYGDLEEIREIEQLWKQAIGSARHSIYIENQFLSSGRIADALKEKLEESDGPEIVIVLPSSAESWLESEAMDSARALIISDLREADRYNRLGIYHPVNASGDHIYVHAKLLIVDDRFIRIGSSNMSGRSMTLDTECDLAMETEGQPFVQETIAALRKKLLAEHLGKSVQIIEAELERCSGSMLQVIERVRCESGPTLQELHPQELNIMEAALARSRLMDPEEPIKPSKRLFGSARRAAKQNRILLAAGVTALGITAARAWRISSRRH